MDKVWVEKIFWKNGHRKLDCEESYALVSF